jgi:hypothetical protein
METAMTALFAVAGLMFSVAIALLVEELVFGAVFRLVFALPRKAELQKVDGEGEKSCC